MRDLGIYEDRVLRFLKDWEYVRLTPAEHLEVLVLNAKNKGVQLETRNTQIVWYLKLIEFAPYS
jgi:hypothetical protein